VTVLLPQALWFVLPVLIGGLLHIAVIKMNWFAALGRRPLDFGATLAGRRLFGDNKTFRGALVMIGGTILAATALAHAPNAMSRQLSVSHWQSDRPELWGLLLGAGYILGELPNSALKRRLRIDPGAAGRGAFRSLFWIIDQLDSVAGAFLLLCVVWHPTLPFAATVAGLALLLHPSVAALMVALGLKGRIG